jgi:hypothetical protein
MRLIAHFFRRLCVLSENNLSQKEIIPSILPPIKPATTDQNYRYIHSYFVIRFTFYDFHFRKYFHLGLCSIPYKEQPREYLLFLGFGLGSPAIYMQI